MPPTKDMSDDENRSSTSADNAENEQEVAEGDDGAGPVPVDTDPLSATPGSMVNTLSRFPQPYGWQSDSLRE